METGLKVLLVEDHPIFRDGLASYLGLQRPGWTITRVGNGEDARAAMKVQPCEIAIIDFGLPGEDGMRVANDILDQWPETRCLLLSAQERPALTRAAMEAGIRGFIEKSASGRDILNAIENILAGHSIFDSQATDALPALSERQAQVLALLGEGHSNKEIRYRLGIAERTVRAHLTDIFTALGVHSRMQAVRRARDLGLVE